MTKASTQRPVVAIFGGTFDPIHLGHLACARYVLKHCAVDQVQLMPCHLPPHRASPGVSAPQRAKMVELAIANEPQMQLQPLELNRNSPSYTAESLSLLKRAMPGSTLAFIIGMDSLCYFKQWYQWQHILNQCHLIVCQRPGYSSQDGDSPALLTEYAADQSALQTEQHGKIIVLDNPPFLASATAIRAALLLQQQNISELDPAVLNYIQQQRLYQSEAL